MMAFWHRKTDQSQDDNTQVIMVSPELDEQLERLYNLDTSKLSKEQLDHAKVVASLRAIERDLRK